jgi:hypothetical protein
MRRMLCPSCRALGPTAIQLIQHLPGKMKLVGRDVFHLKTYVPGPGIERRLKLDVRSLACLSARQLLKRHPRTGSLAKQMVRGLEVDESRSMIAVSVARLPSRLPELVSESETRKEALALYSMCRDSARKVWHIPMMDFRIESGRDIGQLRLLKDCLRRLGQTDGVLLDSGQSYHYYGFGRLSQPEWTRFMTACMLLEPLVDVRYIAHRLLAGKAALRLNGTPQKKTVPKVVACLH